MLGVFQTGRSLDINECTDMTHNCGVGETCINTIGSHGCECGVGWTGEVGSCRGTYSSLASLTAN